MLSGMVNPLPKEKPERNEAYLAFIRGKPCSVTGKHGQSVAHHHPKHGHSTMGGKCSDFRALPITQHLHDEYHRIGRTSFQRKYPHWRPEELIARFNREWELKQGQREA